MSHIIDKFRAWWITWFPPACVLATVTVYAWVRAASGTTVMHGAS